MQPLKLLGRAVLLVLDCTVVLLAIAFILASTVVAAFVTAYEIFVTWVLHHGHAKARSKAGWQQGI